ncbi:hypothetical protein AB0E24_28475 [Streptomyces solisilvae]
MRELHAQRKSRNEIARAIKRSPSTVSKIAAAFKPPLTFDPRRRGRRRHRGTPCRPRRPADRSRPRTARRRRAAARPALGALYLRRVRRQRRHVATGRPRQATIRRSAADHHRQGHRDSAVTQTRPRRGWRGRRAGQEHAWRPRRGSDARGQR